MSELKSPEEMAKEFKERVKKHCENDYAPRGDWFESIITPMLLRVIEEDRSRLLAYIKSKMPKYGDPLMDQKEMTMSEENIEGYNYALEAVEKILGETK